VAIIPSASYGLKAAVNNIPANNGRFAVTIGNEFPSGYYSLETWCKENSKEMVVVKKPHDGSAKGKKWNEAILAAINNDTAAVVLSSVHWSDGTVYDLKAIGKRCKETGALFIVDGTQSVGAMPIDVNECNIDALICASYKWLMGPYSIGVAYYSPYFNNGKPIEDTWLNRSNAMDFSKLANYEDSYPPGAFRYNVGEFGNFILIRMLNESLRQVINWNANEIQSYCARLTAPLIDYLQAHDFSVDDEACRAKHLFGFQLPSSVNTKQLMDTLQQQKISVSLRGNSIRVSTHVFNTENDIEVLVDALQSMKA
jgi:selenocysteine lyase/cysteine desulfurase